MYFVYPVIHQLTPETSIAEAQVAFECGADGVFLISHNGQNEELFAPACKIKKMFPYAKVGMNLLGYSALDSLETVIDFGLDMVWVDDCGVRSDEKKDYVQKISEILYRNKGIPEFYGSVAFKYQREDSNPGLAAIEACKAGMIPTTSGTGTGSAPQVDKIHGMQESLRTLQSETHFGSMPLAIASGMDPDNIDQFLPYATHFLVSTGISSDFYHLDKEKTKNFIDKVKKYAKV